jgi:hypothetical protein
MPELTSRGLGAVLAGLRMFQRAFEVAGVPDEIWIIATDGESHSALDLEEIDELCERLNFVA